MNINNVIKMYQVGFTLQEIADWYGKTKTGIRYHLIKNNIPLRPCSRIPVFMGKKLLNIDSEYTAYWYGFLIGDSYINKDIISVTVCKKDINHLYKLMEFLNIKRKIHFIEKHNTCNITITIHGYYDCFAKNGLCYKKENRFIPKMNKSLYKHFYRGLFDADGGIYKNDIIISFTSKYQFVTSFRNWLNITGKGKNNMAGTIYQKKNTNTWDLKYSGYRLCNMVLSKLYDNSNIYLDRKYNRYLMIKNN